MMTRDKISIIREAYESSLRNTTMQYMVCREIATDVWYIFSDVAGSNSIPTAIFDGRDEHMVTFCQQYWRPEDGDMDFDEEMADIMSAEKLHQWKTAEEKLGNEIRGVEFERMFPDEYETYADLVISNIMHDFEPTDYLLNGGK